MQTTTSSDGKIMLAKALYDQIAHAPARERHSLEYQQGVWQALLNRALSEPVSNPYPPGTACADAFFFGVARGQKIWQDQCREFNA